MEAYNAPFRVTHELYRICFLREQERKEAEEEKQRQEELERRRNAAQGRNSKHAAPLPPDYKTQSPAHSAGISEQDLEEILEEM